MKNIPKSLGSLNGIKEAFKGLRSPQKEFVNVEGELLENALTSYDSLCSPNCHLEQLQPLWANTDNCTILGAEYRKNDLAKELYKSKRRFVVNRWAEVKEQNGGECILCPICEISEASEMDHYVPREIMPEYSFHIHNLIPLCHDCNHSKHDKWLVNGSRVCFNAYFDKLSDPLFKCSIQIDLGYPKAQISRNIQVVDPVLINTINELGLLQKYQNQLDRRLKEVIELTKNHYQTQYDTAENYLQSTCDGYKIDILSKYSSFVDKMLYAAIIGSKDYFDWIIIQLNGLEHKKREILMRK